MDDWQDNPYTTPEMEEGHDRQVAVEIAEFIGERAQSFHRPDRRARSIRAFEEFCEMGGRAPILAVGPVTRPAPEYDELAD